MSVRVTVHILAKQYKMTRGQKLTTGLLQYTYMWATMALKTCTTWPQGYKYFHAQLRMKFILLINVKMPTIVGILTCISRINTAYESLKQKRLHFQLNFIKHESFEARKVFIFSVEISCSFEHEKDLEPIQPDQSILRARFCGQCEVVLY